MNEYKEALVQAEKLINKARETEGRKESLSLLEDAKSWIIEAEVILVTL